MNAEVTRNRRAQGIIDRDLEEISPYAVAIRYPDDWLPLTRDKAVRAVEIARRVRPAVQSRLPSPSLP